MTANIDSLLAFEFFKQCWEWKHFQLDCSIEVKLTQISSCYIFIALVRSLFELHFQSTVLRMC